MTDKPKMYGYMRVSSREQNEDRQRIAMLEYGVPESNLFLDKQSGKDFERPGYLKLLDTLRPGDTLVIKSIDRLGRNYEEIMKQWRMLNEEKKVFINVLDMHCLDTKEDSQLINRLVTEIFLNILSYVAQQERDFILQRQREGIAAAKARGVKFGTHEKEIPPEFEEINALYAAKFISSREAGKRLGVSGTTFLKWHDAHCVKQGLPERPKCTVSKKYVMTSFDFWRIHRLFMYGECSSTIAGKYFRISDSTFRKWYKSTLLMKDSERIANHSFYPTQYQAFERVDDLFNAGLFKRTVAAELLGVEQDTFMQWHRQRMNKAEESK